MLETSTLALETNVLCAGDDHFSAGDERTENMSSNFNYTHTGSYQPFPTELSLASPALTIATLG